MAPPTPTGAKRGRPPKTQASDKAASPKGPAAAPAQKAAENLPPALAKANASHLVQVEAAIDAIKADPILGAIETATPLTPAEGGRAVP